MTFEGIIDDSPGRQEKEHLPSGQQHRPEGPGPSFEWMLPVVRTQDVSTSHLYPQE
jgi:hypothetical protein